MAQGREPVTFPASTRTHAIAYEGRKNNRSIKLTLVKQKQSGIRECVSTFFSPGRLPPLSHPLLKCTCSPYAVLRAYKLSIPLPNDRAEMHEWLAGVGSARRAASLNRCMMVHISGISWSLLTGGLWAGPFIQFRNVRHYAGVPHKGSVRYKSDDLRDLRR